MDIDPLRKRKTSGELYTRRSPIIQYIERCLHWTFDDLLDRASIRDRRHSDYVPSEVLVYHLRQTKSDNSDGRFIRLGPGGDAGERGRGGPVTGVGPARAREIASGLNDVVARSWRGVMTDGGVSDRDIGMLENGFSEAGEVIWDPENETLEINAH